MLVEPVTTFTLGNDAWLPKIDHEVPTITAYNYIFESAIGEAAEQVYPPSPFARSQSSSGLSTDNLLAWFANNLETLRNQYGTRWILIKDNSVIDSSDDPTELQLVARRKGIAGPYITKIPPSSTIWRTAYGSR